MTEVEAWLRIRGIDDPDEAQEYIDAIRVLDSAFVSETAKSKGK